MRYAPAGSFELGLSATRAMVLFTPEGERGWVPGWEPAYPDGSPAETAGTVFTTLAEGLQTTWLIIELDRAACSAVYARITPGRHAGTVRVRCLETSKRRCRVEVEYDMTLLGGADARLLEMYQPERFGALMDDWVELIKAHLGRKS